MIGMPKKLICSDFQVILSSSSWSKNLCIFKEQIWLPDRKCYGKMNSVLTRKKCSKWLDTPCIWIFGHADSNGTGFETVHSGLYVFIILVTAQIFKPFWTLFPCWNWLFLTGKMHQNGLSGTYVAIKACQIH